MKLITNPDEFFEELKHREVRIKIPLLTIIIPLAVLLSIYQYILAIKLSQAFPPELTRFFLVGAYIGITGFHRHLCSMANSCGDNARHLLLLRR